MKLEVTYYKTATGVRMVLCPCRVKVRVLKDGALQNHWAFDPEFRDPESAEDRCIYRDWKFTDLDQEVMGIWFGELAPPEG